jgi:hypothetical protein
LTLDRPEVELPGGDALRHVSPAVQEGQPQLDDLEQVHVAAQQLVLVVGARLEVSDRPTTDYYRIHNTECCEFAIVASSSGSRLCFISGSGSKIFQYLEV